VRNYRRRGSIETSMRILLCLGVAGLVVAGLLAAQQAPVAPNANSDATIRETFKFVLAPVTVTDRNGDFVSGLMPSDFRLLDNGKPQRITEDAASHPISVVVAIQANAEVEKILPQIQKLGALLQAQVLGDEGEVAVLAFDHRIQTLTDFTSDPDKIAMALKKLKAGSWTSTLNDATLEAINMLRKRPVTRRRAILLISESRDKGSQIKPREVLTQADFANVAIYSVDISKTMASLTATPPPPRPDLTPPGGKHLPAGEVSTPTTESQNAMGNWAPLLKDVFDASKGAFVANPLDIYTRYTGGRQYSFIKQGTLDRAVSDIGAELHSQYLLTYSPNNQDEGGFHAITVQVLRPDLKIRTRDGYYLAGKPQ
jgi:VWFA-related protein